MLRQYDRPTRLLRMPGQYFWVNMLDQIAGLVCQVIVLGQCGRFVDQISTKGQY
jgi:hypothetical protein